MRQKKTKDIHIPASTIKTWESLDEKPDRNGWYEIAVEMIDNNTGKKVEVVKLGLYRDGKWIGEFHGKLCAWTYPMRIEDDMLPNGKLRTVGNLDAAVTLAQKILEDVSRELTDSFERMITVKTSKKYTEVIYRYLSANRIMSSYSIQVFSFGLATQADIINTITARVLRKHGVLPDRTDEVRKEIHSYIKIFKIEKKKADKENAKYLQAVESDTWIKIRSAVRKGAMHE